MLFKALFFSYSARLCGPLAVRDLIDRIRKQILDITDKK